MVDFCFCGSEYAQSEEERMLEIGVLPFKSISSLFMRDSGPGGRCLKVSHLEKIRRILQNLSLHQVSCDDAIESEVDPKGMLPLLKGLDDREIALLGISVRAKAEDSMGSEPDESYLILSCCCAVCDAVLRYRGCREGIVYQKTDKIAAFFDSLYKILDQRHRILHCLIHGRNRELFKLRTAAV